MNKAEMNKAEMITEPSPDQTFLFYLPQIPQISQIYLDAECGVAIRFSRASPDATVHAEKRKIG